VNPIELDDKVEVASSLAQSLARPAASASTHPRLSALKGNARLDPSRLLLKLVQLAQVRCDRISQTCLLYGEPQHATEKDGREKGGASHESRCRRPVPDPLAGPFQSPGASCADGFAALVELKVVRERGRCRVSTKRVLAETFEANRLQIARDLIIQSRRGRRLL
jgi:hypothetical protein